LLRGKPEFVLDTQATLAQGEWRGKLTLNFQDPGAINPAQDPMSLLGALEKGLADITASKPLVETVLIESGETELAGAAQGTGSGSGRTGRANHGRAAGCAAASGIDGRRLRSTGRRSLPNHRAVRGWQVVRERSRKFRWHRPVDQESSNDVETMPLIPDDGGEEEEMPSAPGSDAEKPSQEKPTPQ
jgi:hypothetical protein